MGPRWKIKGAETEALSDPMSKIVSELQYSLIMSNSQGLLMSSCVLLEAADSTQTDLLLRSCFGDPVITADKDKNSNKQLFKLSMEEAFYLFYVLKCIQIVAENELTDKNGEQLWMYMSSSRQNFPYFFKAYSHLRLKNWVVKSGSRYGVDFVAYRHHPRLVHSEYAVLVLSGNVDDGRLRVWSDYECTLRLCGSVAKTLLVLHVQKQGKNSESPSSLDSFHVHEQTVTRWNPRSSRQDQPFTELKT